MFFTFTMKSYVKIFFSCIFLLFLISCGGASSEVTIATPSKQNTVVAPSESNIENKFTFMVYFAADNNLGEYAKKDIEELRKATNNKNIKIVFQVEYPDSLTTQRGIIENNQITYVDLKQNLNMANPETLKTFVSWAKENYKANTYILSLWSHGLGWRLSGVNGDLNSFAVSTKGALADDTSKDFMSIDEIGKAIKDAGGVDITIFDACLMQMSEVVYALKNASKIMLASEDNVPVDGFPYIDLINSLSSQTSDLNKIATTFVDSYINNYSNATNKVAVQLSAIDLTKAENLRNSLAGVSKVLTPKVNTEQGNITQAKNESADFYHLGHVDLLGFMKKYNAITSNIEIKQKLDEVINVASSMIIYHQIYVPTTSNSYNLLSSGLALYLPSSTQASGDIDLINQYKALDFNKNITNPWVDVVDSYSQVNASQRVSGNFDFIARWDNANIDIDLLIQEPSNVLINAFNGNVNSGNNGVFTSDSIYSNQAEEAYFANAKVESGFYDAYILYNCNANTTNATTSVNVYYKNRNNSQANEELIGTYNMNCDRTTPAQAKDRDSLKALGNGYYSNFRFVKEIYR